MRLAKNCFGSLTGFVGINNLTGLFKIILLAWIVFIIPASSGCSLTRIVPIQIVRISQNESYTQKFTFIRNITLNTDSSPDSAYTLEQLQIKEMDRIFFKLLGQRNWQNLKDLYGLGKLRDELILGEIYIKGLLHLTLYVDPVEHNKFLIEGMGRYFLIRKETKAILLSGNFHIPLEKHLLEELDQGSVLLSVKLFITRVPEQVTFLNEANLKYKVFMDTRMKNDHVYSVDYSKEHDVFLVEDQNQQIPTEKDLIAKIKIENLHQQAKLIDLRGIQFLRNDYSKFFFK